MYPLILGSESPYKKALLDRLNIPFSCISPNIDETARQKESAEALSKRLSEEKALCILEHNEASALTVIGADQTAECEGALVGKPLTHAQAIEDLQRYSEKTMTFFTSASIHCTELNYKKTVTETIAVKFRKLSLAEIEHYLKIEQPYNCAGAFKCEGLGISLFESIESKDPFALIGLPLIEISHSLRELGYQLYTSESRAPLNS